MLLQVRANGLRVIAQHDHGLAAGRLAHAWRGVPVRAEGSGAAEGGLGPGARGAPGAEPLPFELVLAVALHDFGWRAADAVPRFDPASGRPYDFVSYPLHRKVDLYVRAIDELEGVDLYVALLVSLHYTTFAGTADVASFQADQARRRERLKRALGLGPEDEARVHAHLRYLKLFDNLSLFMCLTPPPAEAVAQPPWVNASMLADVPHGPPLRPHWRDADHLVLEPFPFEAPIPLRIPCRDLDAPSYPDARALELAWSRAPIVWWTVWVEGAEG